MTTVFLGLGSNEARERNLAAALAALRRIGPAICSPVYESEPLLGTGKPYFNIVVQLETDLPVGELKRMLRAIEQDSGRVPDCSTCCPLDIDILLYGDCIGEVDGVMLPHPDVLRRAYVLRPLSDLAPGHVHPVKQQTLQVLWQTYTGTRTLHPVPLDLSRLSG